MVTILLATLNGEDYLKAQLESIAAQTYENWQLVVGDDGSTDDTISIIEEFSEKHPDQVTIIKNDPPQGSAKDNFISLLRNSYGPYFMFCDQDDVWKPDKIYLTLQKMESLEARYGDKIPILVHSDLSVADSNLEMIAESFFQYADIPKRIVLNQLMVQNSVTGCTVMINRCLQQYFLRELPISKIIMHDYWAALIAKVFGKIGFVNESTMYYRQHGNNSVGAKNAKNPVYLYHRLKEGKNSYRRMMIESMEQVQGFAASFKLLQEQPCIKGRKCPQADAVAVGIKGIYEKSSRTYWEISGYVSFLSVSKKQKDLYIWGVAGRAVCR